MIVRFLKAIGVGIFAALCIVAAAAISSLVTGHPTAIDFGDMIFAGACGYWIGKL